MRGRPKAVVVWGWGGGRSIGVSALFFALFLFFFGGHVVRFCGTLPPSCRFWRKGRSGGRAGSGEREREGELDDAGLLQQDLIRLILRHRALAGAWRAQSASLSGAPDWIRCGPRRVFTQWGPRTAHLPCTGDAASNNQILQFWLSTSFSELHRRFSDRTPPPPAPSSTHHSLESTHLGARFSANAWMPS